MTALDGGTALVTGAAHGIGRALVLELARAGYAVVAVDVDREAAEQVAAEAGDLGAKALAVRCDVSSREDVAQLGAVARARFGTVDLLCNNAGVFLPRHAATATHDDWRWVLGVNLWGVIHGIEEFLPDMLAADRPGHILNTASLNGLVPSRHSALYSASKYGVLGLSETLRNELADTPVGVTTLCPAAVSTHILRSGEVRPKHLGEDSGRPADAPTSSYAISEALDPADVARMALDGVREDRAWVFTDPAMREVLEKRHRELIEAFGT
ncbi:SDR family NAD(P)-dependent oxidoreductase [Nocardia alni]|uniref:SDR family NAD(P)-dependent oxidoreductase n=1 Tax=Nocardia alni TaxID=2815723 RepID=UPI001C24F318|nr:SDR family NAD(P)-dependent oxidoreductase [Nocardia alni]